MLWNRDRCSEGVHKFEARFDEVPTGAHPERIPLVYSEEIRRLMLRNVYVRDVCVRCGQTVERRGGTDAA